MLYREPWHVPAYESVITLTSLAVGTVLHLQSLTCPAFGDGRLVWGPWGHEYVRNCMRNSSTVNICRTVFEEKLLQVII